MASHSLRVFTLTDPPGIHDFPGVERIVVSVHVGPAADVACFRGGESHRGRAIHGDIDIIPMGMGSRWVNHDEDSVLVLSLAPEVLRNVAEGAGLDSSRLEVRNRFQMRDAPLENLAWLLEAEMVRGFPCGRLFLDSMAVALGTQLLHRHSPLAADARPPRGGLPSRKRKQVLAYIEDHLDCDLSLLDIARVAGVSVSHCKAMFRSSMGLPVHQYVLRQRVNRAALLLRHGELSISQVALETGFSHQSHLARHMRRLLGVTPKDWKNGPR